MTEPRTYQLGQATVYVDPADCYVRTTFPDGTFLQARPQYDPEDVARSASLGYENVEAMTLDHDPCHSRLAVMLGLPFSPTLEAMARGREIPGDVSWAEEAAVLAIQKFLCELRKHGYPAAPSLPLT